MSKNRDYFNLKRESIRESKTKQSTLIRENKFTHENVNTGVITSLKGRMFIVDSSNSLFECRIGGSIQSPHDKSSVAVVGDLVDFIFDEKNNIGTIVKVHERKSKLSRRQVGKQEKEHVIASNIDKIILFFSVADPYYNRRLIDRYLVIAEQNDLPAIICINKIDLVPRDVYEDDFDIYKELGYTVLFISTQSQDGIPDLLKELSENTSVITGPSGTGKSSFVNLVLGFEQQMTQEISERTTKGQHTTSNVEMFTIKDNGKLIDSPGIRELGLWEFEKNELALYFHEFDDYFPECKYTSCSHTHEPHCAVKDAYEAGEIDPQRFESYLSLFGSLE